MFLSNNSAKNCQKPSCIISLFLEKKPAFFIKNRLPYLPHRASSSGNLAGQLFSLPVFPSHSRFSLLPGRRLVNFRRVIFKIFY